MMLNDKEKPRHLLIITHINNDNQQWDYDAYEELIPMKK